MNAPEYKDPNTKTQEELIGIVDIKITKTGILLALFKYKITSYVPIAGGTLGNIAVETREEWRPVCGEEGCFPKYKIT